jgi:hypothetical protein
LYGVFTTIEKANAIIEMNNSSTYEKGRTANEKETKGENERMEKIQ